DLGFEGVEPAATGRPGYHPSVLLKLYIYGYLNRVQSSRRLEREAGRNLEVIWLLGRLVPDDKVIADFRKDNGPAIRRVSAGVVGYNVQVAVDTVNHLIVTHEVTNTGSDRAQLANVAREAKAASFCAALKWPMSRSNSRSNLSW